MLSVLCKEIFQNWEFSIFADVLKLLNDLITADWSKTMSSNVALIKFNYPKGMAYNSLTAITADHHFAHPLISIFLNIGLTIFPIIA